MDLYNSYRSSCLLRSLIFILAHQHLSSNWLLVSVSYLSSPSSTRMSSLKSKWGTNDHGIVQCSLPSGPCWLLEFYWSTSQIFFSFSSSGFLSSEKNHVPSNILNMELLGFPCTYVRSSRPQLAQAPALSPRPHSPSCHIFCLRACSSFLRLASKRQI